MIWGIRVNRVNRVIRVIRVMLLGPHLGVGLVDLRVELEFGRAREDVKEEADADTHGHGDGVERRQEVHGD